MPDEGEVFMKRGKKAFWAVASILILAVMFFFSGDDGISFAVGMDKSKNDFSGIDNGQHRTMSSAVPAADLQPVIQWKKYFQNYQDAPKSISGDIIENPNGDFYIVGYCNWTWGSPLYPYSGGQDVFLAKVSHDGALQWNLFLGSAWNDYGNAVCLDRDGNVIVYGDSESSWGNPLNPKSEGRDLFVAKLNPDGGLLWNTFLGGNGDDIGLQMAVDEGGNIFLTGTSQRSWGMPRNPFLGNYNAFVAKLNQGGILNWNTFMGDSCVNTSISLNGNDSIFVSGWSDTSWGTPILPFTRTYDFMHNAHVAKLNGAGDLIWNTFLGGEGLLTSECIQIDLEGIFLGGLATPVNWTYKGYIAKLHDNGVFAWSAFFGDGQHNWCLDLASDSSGNLYGAVTSQSTRST